MKSKHSSVKKSIKMPAMRHGFTLMEMLLVLGISGIFYAAFGLPLMNWYQQQQNRAFLNTLAQDLNLARIHAIGHQQEVAIVPNGADWLAGWRVFIDTNHDQVFNDDDQLLHEQHATQHVRIVRDTLDCMYVDMYGLVKRCGALSNLRVSGSLTTQNQGDASCNNAWQLKVLNHRQRPICRVATSSCECV